MKLESDAGVKKQRLVSLARYFLLENIKTFTICLITLYLDPLTAPSFTADFPALS